MDSSGFKPDSGLKCDGLLALQSMQVFVILSQLF